MINFILSYSLSNGQFVVSSDVLMSIDPVKLQDRMSVAVRKQDPEFLKKRFEEHHKPIMESWSKMVPGVTASDQAIRSIALFSKFAKDRIERYEHKLITADMFIDNPRLQKLFVDFFGDGAVNCLYEDGYYDPFNDIDVWTADQLAEEIKDSVRSPCNMQNKFVMLSAAVFILRTINND